MGRSLSSGVLTGLPATPARCPSCPPGSSWPASPSVVWSQREDSMPAAIAEPHRFRKASSPPNLSPALPGSCCGEDDPEDLRGPLPAPGHQGCVGARSQAWLTQKLVFSPLQPARVAQANVSLIPRKRTKECNTWPVLWAPEDGTFIYDNQLTRIKKTSRISRSLMDHFVTRSLKRRECFIYQSGKRVTLPFAMPSEIIEM